MASSFSIAAATTAITVALTLIQHISFTNGIPSSAKPLSAKSSSEKTAGNATIAFHITVNEMQLENLARFFNRIYHPDNLYLIDYHPSVTPSQYLHLKYVPNVHQRRAEISVSTGVSHVLNLLDAMAYFLDREDFLAISTPTGKRSFDYYIPLTPHSYPTIPPAHLRAILPSYSSKSQDAPDETLPNFFHFTHESQLPLFSPEVNRVYVDTTLAFNITTRHRMQPVNKRHPDMKRRTLSLRRADANFVVTHAFVKTIVDSMLAKRLLLTLMETSAVPHRFFASFAHEVDQTVVGPIVRTASLHCVDSDAIDRKVVHAMPNYTPRPPSVAFLHNVSRPCLFTGPFSSQPSLAVRDDIDRDLLIPPGVQGKPAGIAFHEIVHSKMKRLLSTS